MYSLRYWGSCWVLETISSMLTKIYNQKNPPNEMLILYIIVVYLFKHFTF